MKLTNKDIITLYEIAIDAATTAGRYIAQHRPQEIEGKLAGSSAASQVVTEVDRMSQSLILEVILPTVSTYDLGMLAEESDHDTSRLEKDYFWCVDPLDGTLPYIENRPGYAVSIALVAKNGSPVIGVMYDPTKDQCYSAFHGGGAYINGEPYLLRDITEGGEYTIFHHRSIVDNTAFELIIDEQLSRLEEVGSYTLVSHGGAVMNALWNIRNRPSLYFAYPKKKQGGGCLWDYAATVCFYQELGLPVTNYHGEVPNLNPRDTIYMNRKGMLYQNL